MQHVRFWVGLAAPLALLGVGPALAQQAPKPADPSGVNESNQTRELESEIEQYPGPTDGVREEGDVGTHGTPIPEKMQPTPKAPGTRPHAASPTTPTRAASSQSSSIDPSEVQRVMGSDASVIALDSLDAASITRLQVRLQELGHYKGQVDGVAGPQTKAALETYARAQFTLKQRLLQQGQLTSDIAEQLGIQPSSAAQPSGQPSMRGNTGPSNTGPAMRRDAPLLPPGGAPMPPPGMPPLPTPSSAPGAVPPPRGGATPPAPPPSP